MADLATRFFDFTRGADLALDGLLLAEDDGLLTAVLISLFSDRRASPDHVLPDEQGEPDLRGWVGDEFNADQADRIGSLLWLNDAAKQLPEVLERDRTYAQEALHWLVDDGVAEKVDVTAFSPRQGVRALAVAIHRPRDPVARYQFETFWRGQ